MITRTRVAPEQRKHTSMVFFRLLIALLFLFLIKISTTDEHSLAAIENCYNREMHLKFEQSYRETLRACDIDINNGD